LGIDILAKKAVNSPNPPMIPKVSPPAFHPKGMETTAPMMGDATNIHIPKQKSVQEPLFCLIEMTKNTNKGTVPMMDIAMKALNSPIPNPQSYGNITTPKIGRIVETIKAVPKYRLRNVIKKTRTWMPGMLARCKTISLKFFIFSPSFGGYSLQILKELLDSCLRRNDSEC